MPGIRKCENCGTEIHWKTKKDRGRQMRGWVGSLKSRWGKQYDKQSGTAWWCPNCQEAHDWATIRHLFPNAGEQTKRAIYEDVVLQRLRQN